MRRAFVFVFIASLLASGTCGCAAAPSTLATPRNRDDQSAAAVRVDSLCVAEDPFSGGTFTVLVHAGSGVIVGARHVLTARHVVECSFLPTIGVTFGDGSRHRVVVDREDSELDLARLQIVTTERRPFARPAIAAARVGDAACSATAMPAREWNCGAIEAIAPRGKGDVVYGARTVSGNSGSGLYDLEGDLLGVVISASHDGVTGRATSLIGRAGWIP